MVSNEVVLQTVKRMISSGVDDNTIKITLAGISLSGAEIESVLAEAKGITVQPPAQPQKAPATQEDLQEQDAADDGADDISGEEGEEDYAEGDLSEDAKDASDEQFASHAATHTMLEEHAGKIDDVQQGIAELHEKIDSAPKITPQAVAQLEALDKRISSLEKEVGETKANTIALQGILQKILETDRKTLLELQKK